MAAETLSREDIPLKKGKKPPSWYSCGENYLSGSNFINIAFGTLTFIITFALLVQIYYGDYQVAPHGSVATDSLECSTIGTSILKQGGNAVDSAIASAICLAVATPHVTGLEAGGQLLIYNHRTRIPPTVIDFSGSTFTSAFLPKLILGLLYMHREYGSLSWKDLVQPSVDFARNGYLVSRMLVQAITFVKGEDLYGRLEPGQMLDLPNLSETLEKIANIPEQDLYTYLNNNEPTVSQANKFSFYNYDIYVPNNAIGSLLLENLKHIKELNFTKTDAIKPEYVYRLAETTQILYVTNNVTSKFHQGTFSNIAVIDTDDNYVSLVSGMYGFFGSGEMMKHGYVLDIKNNDTVSSSLPLIVTDTHFVCGRRMVFGANGIAQATQLIGQLIIAGENATESIEAPRFHILINGSIGIEGSHLPAFNDDAMKYLETLTAKPLLVNEPYQSCNIIEKLKDDLSSHSDSRGGGIASRF